MNRATLILMLAAGSPVAGQEIYFVHYSWTEVGALTANPVPNPNGILEPGEGARIRVGVTALVNGSSAIGQVTTYPTPYPPGGNGTGTIKGLGGIAYDLLGDQGTSTANGTWTQRAGANSPASPTNPFNGGGAGTIQPGGNRITGFGAAQVVAPENTANGANSDIRIYIGTWNPATYAARTVNFSAAPSVLVPPGIHNSLLVAYGYATEINPNTQQVFTYDLYLSKYVDTDFGAGLNIPVVPAPSSVAFLVLSVLSAGRGRSRSTGQCSP